MNMTGAARARYAALLSSTLPTVIERESDNERYIRLLEDLDANGSAMTAAERRLADLLTLLIEDFEDRHYSLKPAAPVEVLTELMRQHGMRQKDLVPVFGTPSIVSEVINGKRSLTVAQIRKLADRFHVSPEVFI